MMKKMYGLLSLILILYILCGCCYEPDNSEPEAIIDETIDDIFSSNEPIPSKPAPDSGNHFGFANEVLKDEVGPYLVYEGGQMHLLLRMEIGELPDKNFGIHLYVDGQPQPYCTADNETVQYMHTFPSQNGKEFILDLIFTPITGQTGDVLEIGFAVIAHPEYFIDDTWDGVTISDWCGMGLTVRMKYLADPPVAEAPETKDRVISLTQEYIDLTAIEAEVFSSGEYQKEVEYEIYVNNRKSFGNIFCVTDGDKLEVEFELRGSPAAAFGLVLYLDHQPVSVGPEDVIFVRTQNGKKVTVTAQIDLSDFDGEGVFYAVIVPRNYRSDQLGGSCLLTILGAYYLAGAESLEAISEHQ